MVKEYEKKKKKLYIKSYSLFGTQQKAKQKHTSQQNLIIQNYSAECRMQNAEFVVSKLGTCVKMQNQYRTEKNAELEQNKTENRMKKQQIEFRTRTEQNSTQKKLGQNSNMNRIQNQIKT